MEKELKDAINRIADNTHFSEDALLDDMTEWLCARGMQGAKFRAQIELYKQSRKQALIEVNQEWGSEN